MTSGLFIPENILKLEGLNIAEKILLAQVWAYDGQGCFASNRTLADSLFSGSISCVKRTAKSLKIKGYIEDTEPSRYKRNLQINRVKLNLLTVNKVGSKRTHSRVKMNPQVGSKCATNINSNINLKQISCQNSDEFRLSELLLNLILERKKDFKKPDLRSWSVSIERMIRLDKRTPERIEAVIRWCQQDDFWQNNILSTEKLRKQFDQLELKYGSNKTGRDSQPAKPFIR
jgi:hypothetical protein